MSMQERMSYSLIKKAYAKQKRNPVITASTLRLQVPAASAKTTYTFPILQGDEQTVYNEQILLNRADAFTATSIGLFIGGLDSAGANDTTQTYPLYSYPSFAVNTGFTSPTANVLFYNSKINIAINNVQYLQNFDTYRTYNAGFDQQNRYAGVTITGPTNITNQYDSVNGKEDGFVPITPTLQFSGTSKIDISIVMPSSLTVAATKTPIIILIFRGFLSLGASNLNK
jgi:hypothetical protein